MSDFNATFHGNFGQKQIIRQQTLPESTELKQPPVKCRLVHLSKPRLKSQDALEYPFFWISPTQLHWKTTKLEATEIESTHENIPMQENPKKDEVQDTHEIYTLQAFVATWNAGGSSPSNSLSLDDFFSIIIPWISDCNDEKMSKSLGNFFTFCTVFESYHLLTLRGSLALRNFGGVVLELRDDGYSDGITFAAVVGNHKRLISSPPIALFPYSLASDLGFDRYWNYLRKQTFVCMEKKIGLKIDRGKDIEPITDLNEKNLHGRKGVPPKLQFINSLARSLAQWSQPKNYDSLD
ncbi:hypothetical protein V2J09_024345 [Rumex salicifolius]